MKLFGQIQMITYWPTLYKDFELFYVYKLHFIYIYRNNIFEH